MLWLHLQVHESLEKVLGNGLANKVPADKSEVLVKG